MGIEGNVKGYPRDGESKGQERSSRNSIVEEEAKDS